MPGTAWQTDGVVSVQAGSLISSPEPTMIFFGFVGFWAILGSAVLFVGNGPSKGWFTWTLVGGDAAKAGCEIKRTIVSRGTSMNHPAAVDRKIFLFLILTSCPGWTKIIHQSFDLGILYMNV